MSKVMITIELNPASNSHIIIRMIKLRILLLIKIYKLYLNAIEIRITYNELVTYQLISIFTSLRIYILTTIQKERSIYLIN
jgi:hypothetical protein